MLIPIRCFTCGAPVGDVAVAFRQIRAERLRKLLAERGVAPGKATLEPDLEVDMSDVYEALGIDEDCCRMALATTMDFRDFY